MGPFRARHHPSAAEGIPAHVTLLYPFREPRLIGPDTLDTLARCFAATAAFPFTLTAVRLLGEEVVYLAPEPDEPFRQLTLSLWRLFPDTPPYGGRHADIHPHLTVAQIAGRLARDAVAADLAAAAVERLPIAARADHVALLDNTAGPWQTRGRFTLGRT